MPPQHSGRIGSSFCDRARSCLSYCRTHPKSNMTHLEKELFINCVYEFLAILPISAPNRIGPGMKANKLMTSIAKPWANALSMGSTHLKLLFYTH
jgi:hypothetical protein